MKLLSAFAFCLALSASHAAFADELRRETVHFDRGTSGTTLKGSIKGYHSVQYSIGVRAGQKLDIQLDSDNASNYFNVTASGADAALYDSSVNGNGASVAIPSSGNYLIDVYLMRNAARRNETAHYSLTLYIE